MDEKEFDEKKFEEYFVKINESGAYDNVKEEFKNVFLDSRRSLREELRKAMGEVVNNLLKQQENLDPKIVEFVSKNFWDLI